MKLRRHQIWGNSRWFISFDFRSDCIFLWASEIPASGVGAPWAENASGAFPWDDSLSVFAALRLFTNYCYISVSFPSPKVLRETFYTPATWELLCCQEVPDKSSISRICLEWECRRKKRAPRDFRGDRTHNAVVLGKWILPRQGGKFELRGRAITRKRGNGEKIEVSELVTAWSSNTFRREHTLWEFVWGV